METPSDLEADSSRGAQVELLTQQVASLLADMIIQDVLPPGTRLRENMLMKKLEGSIRISRTPLREALKMLAAEGLVDLLPNRGAVVAELTMDEIADMQLVLANLEGLAGELSAMRATDSEICEISAKHYEMIAAYHRQDRLSYFKLNQAIHLGIVAASRSNTILKLHAKLNNRLYRVRFKGNLRKQDWGDAIREHELILQALQNRDGERLRTLLQAHFGSHSELVVRSEHPAGEPVPVDSTEK
jgi:DNA-binding GntR family transcriptional regulator